MNDEITNPPARRRGRPPGAKTDPARRSAHQAITPARRKSFLEALEACGIERAAAVAASPNVKTRAGAASSFRSLAARDPEFAAQVQAAKDAFAHRLIREAVRRGVEGVERGIFQKGERVIDVDGKPATERLFDSHILVKLLSSYLPEFRDKREIEHTGTVAHVHGAFVIHPDELMHLSTSQRAALRSVVTTLAHARGEKIADAPGLPAPDEYESPIVDAEFEDVDSAEPSGGANIDEDEAAELADILS